jgi:hypothetical protein
VFPYRSRLEIGNTEYLLAKINETFDQHLALVYEDIYQGLRRNRPAGVVLVAGEEMVR